MARVLGVVRLSRDREDSTSVVRQRQYIETWAEQNGHALVGFAEDTDVSGGVAPWKRPELAKWLPESIGGTASVAEFDILCVWRLDRLSRRVLHLATLIDWCKKHGKLIASTSEGFDINSPMGGIFVNILAALSEGELVAMRERARSSFTQLMHEGRWRGGFVPYGYRVAKGAAGEGWRLEVDPETSAVLREIVARVIGGASVNSVVRWLNDEKIPIPLDAQRIRAGKEPSGGTWRVANVIKMLRSRTLLGQAEMTQDGKTLVVRGDDGLPVERADPLFTRAEWDELQAALEKNSNKKAGNRVGGSPLLRVAYCECGEPMYRNKGRRGWYYRCGGRAHSGRQCPKGVGSIFGEDLESAIEETFLLFVGELEVMRRVFVPGEDHAADLASVEESLADLRDHLAAGLFRGERGAAEFQEMYRRLEDQRESLLAKPSRPDAWVMEPTGQTYRERWAALSTAAERAAELRASGVRLTVHAKPVRIRALLPELSDQEGSRVSIEIPSDLRRRVEEHTARVTSKAP